MVEFALVLPLLMALLLGMVTGGLAWNRTISINHGAQQAARYAATLAVYTDVDDWLDEVVTRVQSTTDGNANASAEGQYVCIAFVSPNGGGANNKTRRRVEVNGTVTYADQACVADEYENDERRVQVVVRRTSTLNAFFWSRDLTIGKTLVAKYEIPEEDA